VYNYCEAVEKYLIYTLKAFAVASESSKEAITGNMFVWTCSELGEFLGL
jgi:hypothetical protein